jgi:hypothetical protein
MKGRGSREEGNELIKPLERAWQWLTRKSHLGQGSLLKDIRKKNNPSCRPLFL